MIRLTGSIQIKDTAIPGTVAFCLDLPLYGTFARLAATGTPAGEVNLNMKSPASQVATDDHHGDWDTKRLVSLRVSS